MGSCLAIERWKSDWESAQQYNVSETDLERVRSILNKKVTQVSPHGLFYSRFGD